MKKVVHTAMQFVREVRVELSKVVWPSFDEWRGSTIIVLVLVCAFAIYLGLIDLGLHRLASLVFGSVGMY